MEQWLEVQLGNSESEMEDNCPLFVPNPGVDALHKYSVLTQQHLKNIGWYRLVAGATVRLVPFFFPACCLLVDDMRCSLL